MNPFRRDFLKNLLGIPAATLMGSESRGVSKEEVDAGRLWDNYVRLIKSEGIRTEFFHNDGDFAFDILWTPPESVQVMRETNDSKLRYGFSWINRDKPIPRGSSIDLPVPEWITDQEEIIRTLLTLKEKVGASRFEVR